MKLQLQPGRHTRLEQPAGEFVVRKLSVHRGDQNVTDTGGQILIVQYPGPDTGGRPIYDDRFNLKQRRSIEQERTDV